MLKKDYVMIDKKDVLNIILENKLIFTPFINVDNDLGKNFSKFISGQKNDEIYIELEKCNDTLFLRYNEDEIWHQFHIDILRTELYIDGYRVKRPEKAKNILKKKYNNDLSKKFGLLCTQGALAFIIKEMQMSVLDNDYFVAEHKNSGRMVIFVDLEKNSILIKKTLRIMKITELGDDKTIKVMKLLIEFNLKNDVFGALIRIEI